MVGKQRERGAADLVGCRRDRIDHATDAESGTAARVVRLVSAHRQDEQRHTAGESADDRAGPAVRDRQVATGQDAALADEALQPDVLRLGTEVIG